MTNGKPPDEDLSDEELGRLADEYVKADKWRRAAALSDEEREAKIAKSGIDRERARDVGRLVYRKMKEAEAAAAKTAGEEKSEPAKPAATPPAKVIPLAPRRARWAIPLAVAASFAALATFEGPALVAWVDKPSEVYVGEAPPPEIAQANELVDQARVALVHERYEEALQKLDQAVKVYPKAAEYEATKRWRKEAEEGIAARRDGGGVMEAAAP